MSEVNPFEDFKRKMESPDILEVDNDFEDEIMFDEDVLKQSALKSFVKSIADRTLKTAKENDDCEHCDGYMTVRTRRSDGEMFLGCSNYPACYSTKQLSLRDKNIIVYNKRTAQKSENHFHF